MAYGTLLFRLDAHRDALAALWRENLSDARIGDVVPARLRWLYERNPAGAALTWLGVVSGSDSVIGCGSIYPRRMLVDGRMVASGVLADFAVTKNHRVAGAALAIQRAVAKGAGVEFLYGYPNGKSDVIFKRLGYDVVGHASLWVKPLRSAYKVRERVKDARAVRAIAGAIDLGLALGDGALAVVHGAARRLHGEKRAAAIEVDHADVRFDRLWARASHAHAIVGEKTAAYLNWRYTEFTTKKHSFFCLVDPQTDELRGYVVYAIEGNRANVADLFCERFDVNARELLLRLAVRLRSRGVSSLVFSYLGPDTFGAQLKSIGFLRRPGARAMVAYVAPNGSPALAQRIADKNAWFIIDGELDI